MPTGTGDDLTATPTSAGGLETSAIPATRAEPAEPTRAEPMRAGAPDDGAQVLLAEVGRRLTGCLNLRRCLRMVAELAVAHLADAAVAVGPPGRSYAPAIRKRAGGPAEERPVGQPESAAVPGLADALAQFPPPQSRWLDPEAVPSGVLPAGTGPVGELLLVPMPGNAAPGGALILARHRDRPRLSQRDEALAHTFAARAGATVSAAALYQDQAEAMAVLQEDLFPPQLPRLDGVELAGSYQPAGPALLAGGDFYDVLPGGAAADAIVVLGDVCGKGPEAAALTGKVRQSLRALQLLQRRPDELLRMVNAAILRPDHSGQFVTLVVGSVAPDPAGAVRLTLATGGHPPPLVGRVDGSVEEVPLDGMLLGVLPAPSIGTASVTLRPGELCLLYSDGITEARGGATGRQPYGDRRLREALGSCRGMPAEPTLEQLRTLVSDWLHGGPRDDIALLAIRAPTSGRRL
jgi:serine phosphatase RsbU (regulator of sigma subunit)